MPDAAAPVKESPIGMEKARAIALEKVPGGEVASEELKRDHDVLLYSFDIQVKDKKGVEVVNVGATSGEVLSVKHKSPSAMKRDAKAKRLRPS
ncbi:MAG TPA: PepSY domain-containing protein [Thermoanaerobaculia bacterium]|nr:PepSY domain-containing protein [Thermoanaerobaculia bacterium]